MTAIGFAVLCFGVALSFGTWILLEPGPTTSIRADEAYYKLGKLWLGIIVLGTMLFAVGLTRWLWLAAP